MLPLCQQIFKFIQGNALFLRKLLRSFAYQQDMRARHHSPCKRDWIFNELNSSHSSYPQRMAFHYAGIQFDSPIPCQASPGTRIIHGIIFK